MRNSWLLGQFILRGSAVRCLILVLVWLPVDGAVASPRKNWLTHSGSIARQLVGEKPGIPSRSHGPGGS
jgi:hypothetical protein